MGLGGKGGGTSDNTSACGSCWPAVVSLLITRCLYWEWGCQGANRGVGALGVLHMKNEDSLLQSTVENCSLLQTIEHEVRSMGPKFIPHLATRCLYWGVHLTECQPDPKDHQMSRWPNVLPFWATRCLYWAYVWAQVSWTYVSTIHGHQMPLPGGTSDWMSWPNVLPFWATRCLYWGYVWAQVSWTYVSTIHGHQMPLPGGRSANMSYNSWNLKSPFLATRCLYWG